MIDDLRPEYNLAELLKGGVKGKYNAPMDKPVQLFLSYTRKDEAAVAQLYERLAAVGLKPWMDQEDILPGEIWQESILHAIRDSHFFLACISLNSVDKRGFLQRELREALDAWKDKLPGDIYLIPVRLEECTVPEQLSPFQWVDIFHSRGWTRLLRAIQRGTERLDLPVPGGVLSELAPAPASAKTPPPTTRLLTIDKPIHLDLVRGDLARLRSERAAGHLRRRQEGAAALRPALHPRLQGPERRRTVPRRNPLPGGPVGLP